MLIDKLNNDCGISNTDCGDVLNKEKIERRLRRKWDKQFHKDVAKVLK